MWLRHTFQLGAKVASIRLCHAVKMMLLLRLVGRTGMSSTPTQLLGFRGLILLCLTTYQITTLSLTMLWLELRSLTQMMFRVCSKVTGLIALGLTILWIVAVLQNTTVQKVQCLLTCKWLPTPPTSAPALPALTLSFVT